MKERKKYITLADLKKEAFKRPGVKKAYDDLEFEFRIIRALIDARSKKNLTQKELAQKIGVDQSALARFESGRINPTLSFLQKVTSGLGLKLIVK
ncbi:helix-turn-helix transcriptional regulator [Candidatus Nomurabacteria bacterium]|nr:helix-turn-helix transcriptional regulator [Candidatus Nomurabacteria bacterium]